MAEFDDDYDVPFLTYKFKKPDYTETQEKPLNNFLFTDFMDIPTPTIDYSVSNSSEKEDDDKIEDPVKEDEPKKKELPKLPTGKMTNDRKKLLEEMQKQGFSQDEINYYDKLAGRESSWRNHPGVDAGGGRSARGYFQFLDSTLQGLGINKKASEMSMAEQLAAIRKFTNANRTQLSPYLERAKQMGYSEWGLLGGAHLGGVGGVRIFINSGKAASDKFGTSVKNYIELFS